METPAMSSAPSGRAFVVPRVMLVDITADVSVCVLVDGHQVGDMEPGADVSIALGEQHSLLATLPETTFFSRYRETFA